MTPYNLRFRVVLTVFPPLVGVIVGVLLWGDHADREFFSAATHVLALGAVGMALTGRFFRLRVHRTGSAGGVYAMLNVLSVLVFTGVGLFFAFRALAVGPSGAADFAVVAGLLATGITAFGGQALFGTPGLQEEE